MKIIHCADLHLDSKMTSNLGKEKAAIRRAELLDAFSRLVLFAEKEGAAAILIAGDLFDVKRISALARNTVLSEIRRHPQINFYYIKGNHDRNDFLEGVSEVPENLRLFDDTWKSYEEGNIVISACELTKEGAAALGHEPVLDPSVFNIVMLHGQERTGTSKGTDAVIDLKKLKNRGIDYLALGHIHEYKRGKLDDRGVYCYPGCLEGRGFDECGPHGFVLLDIDEEGGSFTDKFIPFARRAVHEVRVDVTGIETSPDMAKAAAAAMEREHAGPDDMAKVVLSGRVDVNAEKDPVYVEKSLEGRCWCVLVTDETTPMADERDYMMDASLKGEFVRLVMGKDELSDEDKGEIIEIGLKALAGDKVLKDMG